MHREVGGYGGPPGRVSLTTLPPFPEVQSVTFKAEVTAPIFCDRPPSATSKGHWVAGADPGALELSWSLGATDSFGELGLRLQDPPLQKALGPACWILQLPVPGSGLGVCAPASVRLCLLLPQQPPDLPGLGGRATPRVSVLSHLSGSAIVHAISSDRPAVPTHDGRACVSQFRV